MFATPLLFGLLACTGADTPTPGDAPSASPSVAPSEGSALEVLYTNNVHGEIEPCG